MTAEIEVPERGANGPIVAMAGDSSGWSLYLKDSVPTFCYTYPGRSVRTSAQRSPCQQVATRFDSS